MDGNLKERFIGTNETAPKHLKIVD